MKVFYALVNLVKVLLFHIVPHSSLFFCVSVTRIAQKVVDLDSDPVWISSGSRNCFNKRLLALLLCIDIHQMAPLCRFELSECFPVICCVIFCVTFLLSDNVFAVSDCNWVVTVCVTQARMSLTLSDALPLCTVLTTTSVVSTTRNMTIVHRYCSIQNRRKIWCS